MAHGYWSIFRALRNTRARVRVPALSLFGDAPSVAASLTPTLPPVLPPSTMQQLQWEKETLGIFVSGHIAFGFFTQL